jgi:hypothetical protein
LACLHATSTDFVAASPSRVVPLGGFPILVLARSSATTRARAPDVASLAHASVARAMTARARRRDDDSSSSPRILIVISASISCTADDVDVVASVHARATRVASIASTSMTSARDVLARVGA